MLNLPELAAQATAGQVHPGSTLYMVATPIGNLADFSLRAIHVLALCDALACEDTRVGAGLLRHLGLHKPLIALHDHNEHEASAKVLARLQAGERVAYVSDAGTPGVSDPGAVLVQAVRAAGLRVMPLPGPSSVVTALSACGDVPATSGHVFAGFLPAKGQERQQQLDALLRETRSVVLFEAPHRIAQLLTALAQSAPGRTVTVCRELSKQFEQIVSLPASELPAWLAADAHHGRGEFVLVLHGHQTRNAEAQDEALALPAACETALVSLLPHLPLKQAVALVAELSGAPRNALYARALDLKRAQDTEDDADTPD